MNLNFITVGSFSARVSRNIPGIISGNANDNVSTGKVNWQKPNKREKKRPQTLDCNKMLTCWMSILEVKESLEWQRATHRGDLKPARWRDSQRHDAREREIWGGREEKWHSNGEHGRPKKERVCGSGEPQGLQTYCRGINDARSDPKLVYKDTRGCFHCRCLPLPCSRAKDSATVPKFSHRDRRT